MEQKRKSHPWQHFKTITKHKLYVMEHCFRAGMIWQGLTHDLSKYSPTEFLPGARYYQGTRSPNAAEREITGYSTAWIHHKAHNKHHYEYWTDMNMASGYYESVPMPRKYLAEMVMDRIAACKNYQGSTYTDGSALYYLEHALESHQLHPQTYRELHFILSMLAERGEKETFRFIRKVVLTGKPFLTEEQ